MWMRQVWVRFYKSFNYDYDLKAHEGSSVRAWEMTDDGWRPFIGVPLEPDITAIVGANESGKSHLLNAIAIVLTGQSLRKRDFCRYSTLFSVENGMRRFPEVGATFALTPADRTVLQETGVPLLENGELQMFRRTPGVIEVLSATGEFKSLNGAQTKALNNLLPYAHKLDTQVDLPDSVSIAVLAGQEPIEVNRSKRLRLLRTFIGVKSEVEVQQKMGAITALLAEPIDERLDYAHDDAKQELGRDLLMKIANIEQSSFVELQSAIADQREGLVNGLIQEMNKSIARHLNIARWWTQDADFELRVSPREHELVFTIRDRTGTDYSFSERSRGLTYFLSYYVQLRSHDRPSDRPEVLLMDEPDAYLSAQGQQDLLRVLEDHSRPESGDRRDQVVYVTHSPFLIDRNAGRRVRVVDKGKREQGTRLVKSATQTHYEPLRTSLGPSVAETAFIGGTNLFVEGISDQVLLTGINARLVRNGTPPSQRLNLNSVTIVPGGSNVAYMLYLARGRDPYKPACAVLLDSDRSGLEAQKAIKRGGAKGRPSVPDDLILMLGKWAVDAGVQAANGVAIEEPEDLVPLSLAVIAARRYALAFLGCGDTEAAALTEATIAAKLGSENKSMWNAIEAAFLDVFETKPNKLGFAKELISFVDEHEADEVQPDGVESLIENFSALLKSLAKVLALAREQEDDEQREGRVQRIIDDFIMAHPDAASRDSASMMLDLIDAATDNNPAGDVIRAGVEGLRRDYELAVNALSPVDRFEEFIATLSILPRRAQLSGKGHLEAVAAAALNSGLPTTGSPEETVPSLSEPELHDNGGNGVPVARSLEAESTSGNPSESAGEVSSGVVPTNAEEPASEVAEGVSEDAAGASPKLGAGESLA